ncbi:hypothetical protein [Streptomyces erythrochromogenes]|uniref:hypothetical protein n=1 Tax=Streptomyces erythrochromogenes TaxID=285574 RepID=UPI0037F469CD
MGEDVTPKKGESTDSDTPGIQGRNTVTGVGVEGQSELGIGVYGRSEGERGPGVRGTSGSGPGVHGTSQMDCGGVFESRAHGQVCLKPTELGVHV